MPPSNTKSPPSKNFSLKALARATTKVKEIRQDSVTSAEHARASRMSENWALRQLKQLEAEGLVRRVFKKIGTQTVPSWIETNK